MTKEKRGEREGEEREKGRKGERGKKEKGREAEEERDKELDSCDKKQEAEEENVSDLRQSGRVQEDPDGGKSDRRIPNSEDVYVTMYGRTLKRSEKLNSCGVSDGCTIQVMSRMRVGGKHKEKKSKTEKKQAESGQTLEQKFVEEVWCDKSPAIRECDKDATVTS